MTQLHVHAGHGPDTAAVIAELDAELSAHAFTPRLVLALYGRLHDDALLHAYLLRRFPGARVIGGTSAGGFMTHHGVMGPDAIGLLLIDDADGEYGVAAAPIDGDAGEVAERVLHQALADCGCAGELPELIWVYQTPGNEEAVVEGLRRVIGDRCAIVGGSSADDDVSGAWRQLGPEGPMAAGLVVAVLFPSGRIGCAFQSGYEPAGASGIVTEARGREIVTIDDRPAAEVYDGWIDHRIVGKLGEAGSILCDTTMFPVAVDAGQTDGVAQYLLIHPESVSATGSLNTFRKVDAGTRLYSMKGDRERLVTRAGRVAAQARAGLGAGHEALSGALLVYCAGCKMAIGDDIARVARSVADELGDAPFIGAFTFGEQGPLVGRNVHGNLMISAVAFGR